MFYLFCFICFKDMHPLIMVAGGLNKNIPNGLTSDVELISTKAGNVCTKRVRPLPGKYYDIEGRVEKESATLGPGIITNKKQF